MSGKRIICENAWLYRSRDVELYVYEGKVCASSNGHLHFETIDGERMGCPRQMSWVTNDSVWLPYYDRHHAMNLIINAKLQSLQKLRDKVMTKTETIIKLTRGELT